MLKARLTFVAILLMVGTFFDSCGDDSLSPEDQLAMDISLIEEYLEENNLTAQKQSSGLFYIQTEAGNDTEHPKLSDEVEVTYKGYFLNGDVFDQTAKNKTIEFPLGGVIKGWQEGLQLMTKGEKATLFLPSSLGYGPNGAGGIPPNSVLVFDVELLGF